MQSQLTCFAMLATPFSVCARGASRQINATVRRLYQVLAIETSCDDTSVAWLDHNPRSQRCHVLQNAKVTLDSVAQGGIVPTQAHEHHQGQLASLVKQVTTTVRDSYGSGRPDLICVTRGPGMMGSLSVGLNVAKGLSVAWDVPFIGVNHMLGHLLVPRLNDKDVQWPFVSLLVSGGHCILVRSTSVFDHTILEESIDIAAGDALDKCGREIGLRGIMIGKELDRYTKDVLDPWKEDSVVDDIKLPNPLTGTKKHKLGFSFAAFITSVKEFIKLHPIETLTAEQHKLLAARIEDAILEHIVTKIGHVVENSPELLKECRSLVCSGGVSANSKLRLKLEKRFSSIFSKFHYPPLDLCTDNAVMIGWAGIEMYDECNHHIASDLDALPLRKWSLEDIVAVSNFRTSK